MNTINYFCEIQIIINLNVAGKFAAQHSLLHHESYCYVRVITDFEDINYIVHYETGNFLMGNPFC